MALLLVLEDNPPDRRVAAQLSRSAGFDQLEVGGSPGEIKDYLAKALEGRVPVPDAMLIDLALGYDSGFEVLRYWRSSTRLKAIPVVVWTRARNNQLEICRHFGVREVVSKDDDPNVLRAALASTLAETGNDGSQPIDDQTLCQ
jgi:CheY-like chemotaxis protein